MKKTKICRTCKIEKELSEFYKHSDFKGGYQVHCKNCTDARRAELSLDIIKHPIDKEIEEKLNFLVAKISEITGIEERELRFRKNKSNVVFYRMIISLIFERRFKKTSRKDLCKFFQLKDETLHRSIKRAYELIDFDKLFITEYNKIIRYYETEYK